MAGRFQYFLEINQGHLDTIGHVNNAVYLQLYEQARWDLLKQSFKTPESLSKEHIGPVIIEAQIKFKKELFKGDKITIASQFEGMRNRLVMKVGQIIYKEDNLFASSALFEIGIMDLKQRKLITPPREWVEAFGGKK